MAGDRETSGRVLSIQRMSTEDGPGLRTTVFFKGCSLACTWCHNPESIRARREVVWHDWKCMGCKTCVEICPQGAVAVSAAGVSRDRELCVVCGTCVEECPTTAVELVGAPWSVDELVAEVVKDRAYFAGAGGVTMSGGEPTLQGRFAAAFAQRLRELGIHVALDTCGMCKPEALVGVVDHVDMVLYDLKILDPVAHAQHTGHENQRILANLDVVRDRLEENGGELWIRTPLIPGATATAANLTAIGAHIAEHVGALVSRWELSAFNNLCQDKYRRLGIVWPFAECEAMSDAELEGYAEIARASGVDPAIVHAEGPTRKSSAPAEPAIANG